jgi:DNA end-binding protein Ku
MTVKSIWTGTLSAGMLVVPVKLGTAVSEDRLPLHQVRRADGSRIEMRRFAKADGREVPYSDLVKGYELPDGRTVTLDKADFEQVYGDRNRDAKILSFVPVTSLAWTALGTPYYMEPASPAAEKAYALLAEAMRRTGRAALVSFALRDRDSLALLYPDSDGYLVLERLNWASDVKKPDFTVTAQVTGAEVEQAQNLVDAMSAEFDWASYTDTSAEKLAALVQAKAETGQVSGLPVTTDSTATVAADLMSALAVSIAQAKAERAPKPVRKPRTRKAAA